MHDFLRNRRNDIIVSVDDFGIRSVAEAILPLARQGKIDRVSVLINYVTSKEQVEALLATGVKIDLHMELIQLVGSGEKVEESTVFRGMNFVTRYALGHVRDNDVELAWTQQIMRFRELFGRYPDGLNSHEHLHYFPRFFRIAIALGARYDIPFVRFARKGIMKQNKAIVSRILAFFWPKDRHYYTTQAVNMSRETADFFVSYDWLDDFDNFLTHLPKGNTEIVFHPERPDEYAVIERYF
jgi:predicted glycoside hydrolase/deacetylase ChbG (UPF0249 family)